MTDRVWVLGAPDPEMEMIERLLRDCGETVVYATMPDGRRVRPETAYRCPIPDVPADATVYAVECIDTLPDGWIRIDHHRPGDPGYGRPPAEFLPASSIGQVIAELARLGRLPEWPPACTVPGDGAGAYVLHAWAPARAWWDEDLGEWRGGDTPPPSWAVSVQSDDIRAAIYRLIPPPYIFAAAADHCLAAAYRGECPGVDPDELMRWRVAVRAAHQGRPVDELLEDVERAREALMDAPVVRLSPEPWEPACGVHGRTGACWQSGGPDPSVRTDACYAMGDPLAVVDMRGQYMPELPEAAARDGVCFIAELVERDGKTKIVCQSGTPEQIAAFMHTWAPAQGLVDIYGDPARGFAGGYMPPGME